MSRLRISHNSMLLLVIAISLAIKFALFAYAAINIPSSKFMPDTPTYLDPGINLVEKGIFATFNDKGEIKYEIIRTPGYPVFLAILNRLWGFSFDLIIVIQILLITFAGFVVYKAACLLDKNIALLACGIFLFDMPVTISTLMLLSEALYTVFIALFIYLFLKYLKGQNIGTLILSSITLVIATYIRPISYYLGVCVGIGIIFALLKSYPIGETRLKSTVSVNWVNFKRALIHFMIFLFVFYSMVGLWNYRNYVKTNHADFTSIDNIDLKDMGLTHRYTRDGKIDRTKITPFFYYTDQTFRSLVTFFTIPGTLKYLHSDILKVFSKIYGYPWVAFWLIGLLFAPYRKLGYLFLLLVLLYFAGVSCLGVGLCVGSRFRVPVMPLISILSASGWVVIISKFKTMRYALSAKH